MSQNHLAAETSPYLLQHKDNPVHWRPWGDDALNEAKRLDRPILLSVGYAACHWCHVMAHESFEDSAIAALMNAQFINIKVDREERPDIDTIYQAALAMLGQQGGWPLTMFLTPHAEPFWGGTYFPPASRYGRPGFPDVLRQISAVYSSQKETLNKNVDALRGGLAKLAAPRPGDGLSLEHINQGAITALRLVDPIRGGTSGAPKFPQPSLFRLLWRAYQRTNAPMFREAVLLTLNSLCTGGIYDHLGGGFARYATDSEWLVPHFEKMLYDNALLIELLSEVWRETRSPLYAQRVRETIDWALAEMTVRPTIDDGTFGFASALDADSEGSEGKFYVWAATEIVAALGDEAHAFSRAYDVRPHGNWEGQTILNIPHAKDACEILADERFARARATLREIRKHRVRPGRDDKVLADWNGLMICALVQAATTFGEPAWLAAARSAFAFVIAHMHDAGRLRHVWRNDSARHPAIIDDYANLARAALALFEATGEAAYLTHAKDWTGHADHYHWDGENSGYFLSAVDTTDVIVRPKSIHDNAVPSGNGTMVEVLARLWLLTGEDLYRRRAEALTRLFSADDPQYLVSVPGLLTSAELLERAILVVILGEPTDPAAQALRAVVASSPSGLVVLCPPPAHPDPSPLHPAQGRTRLGDTATAYVCIGTTCSPPVTRPDDLRDLLSSS
ncbi:MAG: thioredoxin domain-containing protein [Rhodospirillales bacterium]|nr:thioredoxin domain-containing protein [Rhodospirillales bacterium]